ncbi:MAG: hypothetical protein M0D55_12135 [Elusimicrobiota bacterium]|nr:MAG: hypothetical protein M0D55_12135 [Elusimicrobiota bacterium]
MSRPEPALDRRDAGLFGAALLLRAAHAFRAGVAWPPAGDSAEYWEFARSLAETGLYFGPGGAIATRMPGYPVFLAAVRLLLGPSPEAVIAVQCLLGAAACVLIRRVARRVAPEGWALAAAALAAAYGGLVTPAAMLLSESLYSFLLIASAWALYREDWTPARRAAGFGLLSGALYLVRPEPLPYAGAVILLMPALFPRFGLRQVGIAAVSLAVVAGLWVGRNYAQFGRLVPGSTVSRSVVYLSLWLPADRFGWDAGPRFEPPPGHELVRDRLYGAKFRELSRGLSFAQKAKAYAFNFVSILYPFLPGYDWTYMLALPFAAWSLVLLPKRRELWPFALAIAGSLTIFTFCGGWASRYRQGVSPYLLVLAAAGAASAVERLGRPRFRAAAGTWLGLNLVLWAFQPQARALALGVRDALWGPR